MSLSKYRDKVIAKELSYVGVTGGAATGDDEFILYYNKIAGCSFSVSTTPWCAIFQTYNLRNVGIPEWVCPNFAGCGTIDDGFLKPAGFHKNWNEYVPLPGDLIIFDWSGCHKSRDHVGMVEKVEGNVVYTIEGNSNGGYSVPGVRHKSYDLKSKFISLYGAIPYEAFENGTNPYAAPNCELKSGMNNVAVRWLQWILNLKCGMSSIAIDGGFGAKTEAAVKTFQEKYSLKVTGVCDSATIAKLESLCGTAKKATPAKATAAKDTSIKVNTTTAAKTTTTTAAPKVVAPAKVVTTATAAKPIVKANELSDMAQRANIKKFQRWANTTFKMKLAVDGKWGPESHKAAIAIYQTMINQYKSGTKLVVDGEWGPLTRTAAASACSLVKGNVNNSFVLLLKYMLSVNDYDAGVFTTKCNVTLTKAITRYQKNHNFIAAQCDGECGQNTWTELFTKTS